MKPERLRMILRVLEDRRGAAQQSYVKATESRNRITKQIEEHEQRLKQKPDPEQIAMNQRIVIQKAQFHAQQRLLGELQQLNDLLQRFDREELKPKHEAFIKTSQKALGFQRLIERREVEREKDEAKRAQKALEEVALQRWLNKR